MSMDVQHAQARRVRRTSVEKVHELLHQLPALAADLGPALQVAMPLLEPKLRGMVPSDPAVLDQHLGDLAQLVMSLVSDPEET